MKMQHMTQLITKARRVILGGLDPFLERLKSRSKLTTKVQRANERYDNVVVKLNLSNVTIMTVGNETIL